jgi:LPXTG-motif cell wall-anchored protein
MKFEEASGPPTRRLFLRLVGEPFERRWRDAAKKVKSLLASLLALTATKLLELGEHRLDIELLAGLFLLGGFGLFLRRRRH